MRPPTSPSPITRTVLRPRDPVTELMIVATVVLSGVSLLFLAVAQLVG